MTLYYKIRQILWQNETAILSQNALGFLLQNVPVLLQNATVIPNCDDFITKCDSYYKIRRLLQITTVHCSPNRGRLASHYQYWNWSKRKKKYTNFRDHRNSAIDKVVDISSSEITGKPISGRGYRPCFNRFLLNVKFSIEINQLLTLFEMRSYAHLDYRKRGFFQSQAQSWLWTKIIISRVTGEN